MKETLEYLVNNSGFRHFRARG